MREILSGADAALLDVQLMTSSPDAHGPTGVEDTSEVLKTSRVFRRLKLKSAFTALKVQVRTSFQSYSTRNQRADGFRNEIAFGDLTPEANKDKHACLETTRRP